MNEQPLFIIGVPRSGTTIVFDAVSSHPRLGWLSNYSALYPAQPWLNGLRRLLDNRWINLRGRKKQYGSVRPGNRYYPQPDEAYEFWDRYTETDFSRDYLLGCTAPSTTAQRVRAAVQAVIKWQGRPEFSTKLTGPGRIHYLTSIFPGARYVSVIRDARAVVSSLMRMDFWERNGGLLRPYWNNGLDSQAIAEWQAHGSDPVILAAMQWKCIIETTRKEAGVLPEGHYMEVRYEDFVTAPTGVTGQIFDFAGLPDDAGMPVSAGDAGKLPDMSVVRHKGLTDEDVRKVEFVAGEIHDRLRPDALQDDLHLAPRPSHTSGLVPPGLYTAGCLEETSPPKRNHTRRRNSNR